MADNVEVPDAFIVVQVIPLVFIDPEYIAPITPIPPAKVADPVDVELDAVAFDIAKTPDALTAANVEVPDAFIVVHVKACKEVAPEFINKAYELVRVPPPDIVGAPAKYKVYALVAAPDAKVIAGAVK
jgi:hypothetical protein